MPNRTQKAFEVCLQNRNFEIELFWKRALFFWGFIGAAFVAYATLAKDSSSISLPIACFGFVCSIGWSAANRGSKYWQEYWEQKVELLEKETVGDLFIDDDPKSTESGLWAARKLSVSKITMGISDYLCLFWLALSIYEIKRMLKIFSDLDSRVLGVAFFIFTILYVIFVGQNIASKQEGAKIVVPEEPTKVI